MKISLLALTPKRAALVALVASLNFQPLAHAQSKWQPAEILANGHFESPALAGSGQIWSTDPAFSLPGWTYPTGTNQCFLEFGQPLGTSRYADGRQALCLHGQGTPVFISQMFNTISGRDYTITLAQNDENNAGQSASQITVTVAGMSRVLGNWGGYHVYDDHGYVPQVLNFTATSNLTTLTITDTSPAGAPSPLIDAVCVNPGSGRAIRSGTPIPGHLFDFASFGTPVLSSSRTIYRITFVGKASATYGGIWAADGYCSNGIPQVVTNPPPPNPLVDTATAIPGGSGTFAVFSPGSLVSLNPQPLPPGRTACLFWAGGSGGQQGFYAASAGQPGSPARVADTGTAIPNHAGETFANFVSMGTNLTTHAASDGSNLVLRGAGADGWEGVYCGSVPIFIGTNPPPPPTLGVVADRSTMLPGGADMFATFVNTNLGGVLWPPNHLAINGNDIVFYGASVGGTQGLYCGPVPPTGGVSPYLFTVVDTTFSPTGGCCQVTGFGSFDLASAPGRLNVAFVGMGPNGQQGVYDEDIPICPPTTPPHPPVPGPIWTLADTNTAIPQGTGNFTGFAGVACGGLDGISITFVGLGTNGQKGIYAVPAPRFSSGISGIYSAFKLSKVIDLTDMLDGKSIADVQLAAGAVQGSGLAYKAVFTDGSQGIYTMPLINDVMISSMTISNNDIHLVFNAPAGRNFWVLGGTDLGTWDTNSVFNLPGTGGTVDFLVPNAYHPFCGDPSCGARFFTVRWSGQSPDLGPLNP